MPERKRSYEGKSVVITGGSRGLGLALARELVFQGANVTLLARDPEELERACKSLNAPKRVFSAVCDVNRAETLDNAFAEARARFGRIDVLINNAGSIVVGPFFTMNDEDFDATMNIHLKSVIHAIRCVRPYFHQIGGGRIINISSIGGVIPVPHLSAYCASKFALAGLSESARAELASEKISVTTVYPGLMRTGSPIQAVFKGDHKKEFAWFSLADSTPGLALPAEVAARKILEAGLERRARLVLGAPAKVANWAHALLPETFSAINAWVANLLPVGRSQERHTGAESRGLVQEKGWASGMQARASRTEHELNQEEKTDADFNLGLHPRPN
jgi:NAD(P)-dependent dehydrogenase (short-subunit alcohol dehydrogenase family)